MSDLLQPPTAAFDDFLKLDIRVGRVTAVEDNANAKVPAYVLTIDFGPLGPRDSSAQITANYRKEDLIGEQVVAVVNFPPKRVAGVKSECLVLAAVCGRHGTVLLRPAAPVLDGTRVA